MRKSFRAVCALAAGIIFISGFSFCLISGAKANDSENPFKGFVYSAAESNDKQDNSQVKETTLQKNDIVKNQQPILSGIIQKRIMWTDNRENLIRQYARTHYGMDINRIIPQAIVVHWTVANNHEGVWNYFYGETMPDDGGGTLNVASHYIVARDGTIFQLTDETALNRHSIGYNWCSIGIENCGGEEGREDMTQAQLESNIKLIRYLRLKYPTISYVWGHYQQHKAKATGLFIEKLGDDYWAEKVDPGPIFMKGLREGLSDTNLGFFEE